MDYEDIYVERLQIIIAFWNAFRTARAAELNPYIAEGHRTPERS